MSKLLLFAVLSALGSVLPLQASETEPRSAQQGDVDAIFEKAKQKAIADLSAEDELTQVVNDDAEESE